MVRFDVMRVRFGLIVNIKKILKIVVDTLRDSRIIKTVDSNNAVAGFPTVNGEEIEK